MNLRDIVKEYMECQRGAFKRMNIEQAWRKSGIKPFNPDIFTDKDFAPSIPSSTQAWFPESFPTRLPQAPDASSDDALFDPYELDRREGREEREDGERDEGGDGDSEESETDSGFSDSDESNESNESDDTNRVPSKNCFSALSSHMPSPAFSRKTWSQTSQPSSAPTRSSSLPTIQTSSSRRDKELERLCAENARLRADNAGLKEESASLKAQRDAAQAHAVFAGQQYAVYKHRLHEKTKKKEASKRVSTSARVLTLMQGRLEIAVDAAKKATKSQELQKKKEKDAC
ncbi:hypothetical protein DFH05DRAFT_1518782 [Lentinula detonsa]|uniref:Uncharacterized protein n=1 Tax=Lentinula detonsa TaxID=2804962 RepID=A0A9W8PBF1_9AGAR|nr:hypothetical protein DFH05DRAFT_1518782 [Lentinula detonsa]